MNGYTIYLQNGKWVITNEYGHTVSANTLSCLFDLNLEWLLHNIKSNYDGQSMHDNEVIAFDNKEDARRFCIYINELELGGGNLVGK